jgi:hypothetical protein
MSLEDCFKKFRPRSGINKLRAREGRGDYLLPVYSGTIFARPRYYPAGKDDNFKYWSSFRVSGNTSLGISKTLSPYLIEDAAPFVVYKNSIPTNKIVMKIQTNTSLKDNGSFIDKNSSLDKDPFFIGSIPNLKSTPLHWKVQKLNSDYLWEDIYSTEEDQFTEDAGWDGYFQLSYGLKNDEVLQTYKENFLLADITAKVKRMLVSTLFEELSLRSIALAPLSRETPLTSAASFDVKTGLCYRKKLIRGR